MIASAPVARAASTAVGEPLLRTLQVGIAGTVVGQCVYKASRTLAVLLLHQADALAGAVAPQLPPALSLPPAPPSYCPSPFPNAHM